MSWGQGGTLALMEALNWLKSYPCGINVLTKEYQKKSMLLLLLAQVIHVAKVPILWDTTPIILYLLLYLIF